MNRLTLEDLPSPPRNTAGWPWTEESPQYPEVMANGISWPRISIVTPSLNQVEFIEETIRSILLQGYPDLEYIIVDGGSTDGSIDIIQKYSPWLAGWVSEVDEGQSQAINKGFKSSTGEIMAWLNSDDIYFPDALGTAAAGLKQSNSNILFGSKQVVRVVGGSYEYDRTASPNEGTSIHAFPIFSNGRTENFQFLQSSMFWDRRTWRETGELDERHHYCMDKQWCLRALAHGAVVQTSEKILSRITLHSGSKTQDQSDRFASERAIMCWRFIWMPEFRPVPCALESLLHRLRQFQDLFYARRDALHQDGRKTEAFLTLQLARLLRRARLAVIRLARLLRPKGTTKGATRVAG